LDANEAKALCRRGNSIEKVTDWYGPCYLPYAYVLRDRPIYGDSEFKTYVSNKANVASTSTTGETITDANTAKELNYEPSTWLNNTKDPILSKIWFDHQKSLSGIDSAFGNASAELVFGDSTDYDATGWVLDLSPVDIGPKEWIDAMTRLKNGDKKGPEGKYNQKRTIIASGGIIPATTDSSFPSITEEDSTNFATGSSTYQQSNKYIDRSTRAVTLNCNLYNPSSNLFVTVSLKNVYFAWMHGCMDFCFFFFL
jgi:hypothetical protein